MYSETKKKIFPLLKHFYYSLNLLGFKEKVLGIELRKIMTPVSSLYDSYSLRYEIFRENQNFEHPFFYNS